MFSVLNSLKGSHEEERRARKYRALLGQAAKMGGGLFGQVPEGVRREFFCLDERTWVWHEEWTDQAGQPRAITTRYDIRPNGILKAQDGQPYRYVTLEEGKRLYKAMKMYNKMVRSELS